MTVPGQGERSEASGSEAPAAAAKRPLAAEGRAVALELHRTQARNYTQHVLTNYRQYRLKNYTQHMLGGRPKNMVYIAQSSHFVHGAVYSFSAIAGSCSFCSFPINYFGQWPRLFDSNRGAQ